MNNAAVNIYTDGSSLGNPGPGGYGIIMEWSGKNYIKEFSAGYRLTTNNRMELLAIIVALEKLKKKGDNGLCYFRFEVRHRRRREKMGFWMAKKRV